MIAMLVLGFVLGSVVGWASCEAFRMRRFRERLDDVQVRWDRRHNELMSGAAQLQEQMDALEEAIDG